MNKYNTYYLLGIPYTWEANKLGWLLSAGDVDYLEAEEMLSKGVFIQYLYVNGLDKCRK